MEDMQDTRSMGIIQQGQGCMGIHWRCAFHSMCHGIGTARLTAGAEGPRRTTIPSTVVYIRRTLGDIFIESVRGLDAECDGEILPDEGITRGGGG